MSEAITFVYRYDDLSVSEEEETDSTGEIAVPRVGDVLLRKNKAWKVIVVFKPVHLGIITRRQLVSPLRSNERHDGDEVLAGRFRSCPRLNSGLRNRAVPLVAMKLKKKIDKQWLAKVRKAMAKPRLTKSVRHQKPTAPKTKS